MQTIARRFAISRGIAEVEAVVSFANRNFPFCRFGGGAVASNDFKQSEVQDLLARCHRRCCVCHRFCGTKIELDHIQERSKGGSGDIGNALPVCFDCHAEIHGYDPNHPRGKRFTAKELEKHRDQWLDICEKQPGAMIGAPREIYVGPLQGLIDELEYNRTVIDLANESIKVNPSPFFRSAAPLKNDQFSRAISEGAIAVLHVELKSAINRAYSMIGKAQLLAEANAFASERDNGFGALKTQLSDELKSMVNPVSEAHSRLLEYLSIDVIPGDGAEE
ncbi:MAG: hypothetical protein C0485_13780 [Pirellula sp.]|nr:hypothetical protein [Pirellula sp.]